MRSLMIDTDIVTVLDETGWSRDCDTWDDIRSAAGSPVNELDSWTAELCAALELDPAAVDVKLLLDVARDAAHNVARPAAPLTTFMVGLAAGTKGGGAAAITAAAETAQRLALARASDD